MVTYFQFTSLFPAGQGFVLITYYVVHLLLLKNVMVIRWLHTIGTYMCLVVQLVRLFQTICTGNYSLIIKLLANYDYLIDTNCK